MKTITQENDITVFGVKAETFPEGITAAYNKLNEILPDMSGRQVYGLSWMEDDKIIYYAAINESEPGEGDKHGCLTRVLKKGNYISKTINEFMDHIPELGKTFEEMFRTYDYDPEGCCVEYYFNDKDVECRLRLK